MRRVGPEGRAGLVESEGAEVAARKKQSSQVTFRAARARPLGQVRSSPDAFLSSASGGAPRAPGSLPAAPAHYATSPGMPSGAFPQMAMFFFGSSLGTHFGSMSRAAHSPALGLAADVREPLPRLLHPGPSRDAGGRLPAGRRRRHLARPRPRALRRRTSALLVLAGVVIWTPTEYWLHRLVFHWQPRFRGGDRLHFMIHGVHHDHPNDAMRLVMPPAASIPLAALFFGALRR